MNNQKIYVKTVIAALVVLFICTSNAFSAPPNAPSNIQVFPRYGATISLVIRWTQNSNNEDGFQIQRREQGTATFTNLATVAANVTEHIDTTATANKMWEYRVRATSAALGNSGWTAVSHATSPKQVWPIHDGDHNLLHNFGTPLNFMSNGNLRRYFHEGVDVSASGKRVDAARGGIVTNTAMPNSNGGQMRLNVDFDRGAMEGDTYAHTVIDAVWGAGDLIAPGERVGTVNNAWFNRDVEADHVHWGDGHMHNLDPYTTNADRDPNLTAPIVSDINNDGHDFIVVNAAANDHTNPRNPAWRDVDFIVDAFDDMSADMALMCHPDMIGYWIQSGVSGGENVRSAATPYWLIKFDFQLNGPGPAGATENAVVYWDLDADMQGIFAWQSCLSWLVTNTSGTDGSTANVDANQFWRTDARKGTGAEPNGSDAQRARENQEAKFPDGTHFVHIMLKDLVHSTDTVRSVLVDNSRPYVRKVTVYSGLNPIYHAEWVWDSGTAQLAIQPATFDAAAAFTALRTQDVNIKVEFSEPMQTASISAVSPALGSSPTLTSTQPAHARTIWEGLISNLDIADNGSDDGNHMITFAGTDLAGNQLLRINNRNSMGTNHHNRNAGGTMQGTGGTDTIHGFKVGPLSGVIDVTVIFMKQTNADPATPSIVAKTGEIQQALNDYFGEVSYNEISFATTGHGWYKLNNPLNWYYTSPRTPLVDLVQEAISAAEADNVNMTNRDYVLVVTDETVARPEWSTNGGWPYNVTPAPGWKLMASGALNLDSSDERITNLMGRIIGLIDLFAYPEVTVARPFVDDWSHMSDKETDVHVMGWEKWRVGWLDETGTATGKTVTRVPKPPAASPIVNQTYTILPLDSNNDGTKMVAVEIADRLHYTAEYRRQQNLDSNLPDDGVLIVKANDKINQGEGPAIVQESPVTSGNLNDATFDTSASRTTFNDVGSGVNIEVISMNANQAQIRLNYAIPPTENNVYVSEHDNRWKAEDIWVDAPDLSDNFAADPLSVKDSNEKPVLNKLNKVYGRIRNKGHADATNFEVHLDIREPWGAGGPWHSLNVKTITLLKGQDNDANDYALIVGDWTPTGDVHSCVQLTILGVANDVDESNNWTQENISEFVTTAGSPYDPVVSRFEVENPYNESVPVFFKIDGLPPSWSYILSPERLFIPANDVGAAQVTIQPHDAAPLCSVELITISAYTPRVDTLKLLGAITLQVALKNGVDITKKSWVDCGRRDDKDDNRDYDDSGQYTTRALTHRTPGADSGAVGSEDRVYELDREAGQVTFGDGVRGSRPQTNQATNLTTGYNQGVGLTTHVPRGRCVIYTQGCTDPALPNTKIAIIYTAPDGTKQVRYVMTDENGCYLDMLTIGEPGIWQTQVVLEEDDCRAESKTPKTPVIVGIPGGDLGDFERGWRYSIHMGPNYPLPNFSDVYDPGCSFNAAIERSLFSNLSVVAIFGFHRFFPDMHFIQTSGNLKFTFLRWGTRSAYVNAGGGLYVPKNDSQVSGYNAGAGLTWALTPRLGLDFNFDYHFVNYSNDELSEELDTYVGRDIDEKPDRSVFDRSVFLDMQMGLIFKF